MNAKKRIQCEQALKQIYEYLDHEMGGQDREAMQAHLHTCKSCFSRVEFERRLKEKLGALPEESVSQSVEDRIKGLLRTF